MTKTFTIALAATAALAAGAVRAQQIGPNPPTWTVICLDPSGRLMPKHCDVPGSRLDARENICLCSGTADRIKVSVCPPGVHQPAESAALERARAKAVTKGSLEGASYNGQPMCVERRKPEIGQ